MKNVCELMNSEFKLYLDAVEDLGFKECMSKILSYTLDTPIIVSDKSDYSCIICNDFTLSIELCEENEEYDLYYITDVTSN